MPVTTPDISFAEKTFSERHIGVDAASVHSMLEQLGYTSMDAFIRDVVPDSIFTGSPLSLPAALSERDTVAALRAVAAKNVVAQSLIGQGYYGTITPAVIVRNILENPAWYTAYTPYQPEISQGRLEALLNFQTVVTDLTGLDIANASMLDEGSAAAEAMAPVYAGRGITADDLPGADPELLPLDEEAEAQRQNMVQDNYGSTSQGVVDYTESYLFRDLWLRPDLAPRDRSLVTVAGLIAAGQPEQMTFHLNRAMDNGLTQEEAGGMLAHLAFYAGWPRVFSAMPVAKDVFANRAK